MITDVMLKDTALHERMARRYCVIMGTNPDDLVGHAAAVDPASGYQPLVWLQSPRWVLVARDVQHQLAWLKVISEVV